MTIEKKEDVSVLDEIAQLEKEQEEYRVQKETLEVQLKHYREAEDPETGVYHAQEIFSLSQEKLRLAAEIDIRRRKVNRLRLGNASDGILQ